MSTDRSPIVGIDLGTTYCAIAHYDGGKVRFFTNPLGQELTPSVIAWDRRSQGMVVGRQARDILATRPEDAAALFKREMGRDTTLTIGDRSFTPVELSAWMLDALRADAERALKCAVTRCVVTVPAYFNEAQRFATKRAAETAGFTVERVLNEPTAAAIAYGLHGAAPAGDTASGDTASGTAPTDDEKRFLVFDLGGGTFDVCVMELFEGMLEVRGVAGESRLGGEDFTEALVKFALEDRDFDQIAREQPDDLALVRKRAEVVKRTLSRWPRAELLLPEGLGSDVVPVSREAFERATASLRERMVGPCRAALRSAGLKPDDIDEILLVGGATRMPGVRAFVQDVFGKAPLEGPDPDRVVAHGAAIQAALCDDDAGVRDLVVTDVASHSLGVEVTREIAGKRHVGFFSPIIHRNTVIPTSKVEVYQTVHDGQRAIDLEVYEGEARRVQDNHRLGVVEITDLPRRAAGSDFSVRFTYDLNGILEVEARLSGVDRVFRQIFHREGKILQGDELIRAQDRIRGLKADPKGRPRYRDALTRADLLWRELPAAQRPILDLAIDAFESSLGDSDTAQMESRYEALNQLCDQLGGKDRW
ncbi:MAG: Hsp70 family protein [Myxococcales bacterium]|nr:Hsp70 family protein [Myxococcales bacterium]